MSSTAPQPTSPHGQGHVADRHESDVAHHGSHRSYLLGFALSVVLTAIPFGLVMTGALDSRLLTAAIVVACAVAQILVHMVFFLHMSRHTDEGWTVMSLLFTVIVVGIMLAGSLWVMHNLNGNMMPAMGDMTGFGS